MYSNYTGQVWIFSTSKQNCFGIRSFIIIKYPCCCLLVWYTNILGEVSILLSDFDWYRGAIWSLLGG